MPSAKRQRKKERQQERRAALLAEQRRRRVRSGAIRVVVAAAALVALVALIVWINDDDETETATTTTTQPTDAEGPPRADPVEGGADITGETPCPAADGSSPRASSFEQAPPMCIDPAKDYVAVFDTSEGTIRVDLTEDATPGTVNNFVVLARYHYYDGTAVHRTDDSIDIIQGGSPHTQTLQDPGPGYTIKDEGDPATRKYTPGDLVMARSGAPDSAGAQYFFVGGPGASALDSQGTYVTFGKVLEGQDVVEKILGMHQPCPPGADQCLGGAPSSVVIVRTITIEEQPA